MQDLLSIGTNRRESMIGTGIGLGLAGYRLNPPGVLPVLDLRFSQDKSLTAFAGPTPSFSRASSGTYFDANGVLQSAGVNAARFNHVYNGTSWVSRGLLVEEQRTNNAKFSEDFSNASASKVRLAVTANASSSPDGTNSADLCYPSSTGIYSISELPIGTILNSTAYTISCFFKYSGKPYVYLYGPNGAYLTYFNIQSGVVGTIAPQVSSATIQNVGNGWYRCSACYVSVAGGTGYFTFGISDADANQSVTASGTDGVLAWGAQFETGSFATSYIQNLSSSSTTRSADVCQITGSDFSGFWNGAEGTLVIEYDQSQYATGANNYAVAALSSGSALMAITSSLYSGSPSTYWQVYNGTAQAEIPFSMIQNGTAFKFAAAYKANDFAATQNGAAVGTDTSGSIPSANQMSIGYFSGYGQYINGHIARLRYYPTRLTNTKLQELST